MIGGILKALLEMKKRPLRDANAYQALLDSSPVGSVGAPGGIMANPNVPTGRDNLAELGALLSFAPGIGDAAGLATDIRTLMRDPSSRTPFNFAMSGLGVLPFIPAMTVFHGSPHKFDAFDMSKIGTGEGAQAYGHGLYFAENAGVAGSYKQTLSAKGVPADEVSEYLTAASPELLEKIKAAFNGRADNMRIGAAFKNPSEWSEISPALKKAINKFKKDHAGNLYTVDIPDEAIDKMLDWDAPLSEQPESVRKALRKLADTYQDAERPDRGIKLGTLFDDPEMGDGADLLFKLGKHLGVRSDSPEIAKILSEAGIPGIKYYDGSSRAAGQGTRNFVVFDDKLPKILKRE